MNVKYAYLAAAMLLAGCGSERNPYGTNGGGYGQIDNTKEFGVVISQHETQDTNAEGIARNYGGAASNAAIGAVNNNTSGIFSPITNLFTSSNTTGKESEYVTTIEYVIKKDSGQQIVIDQIPQINEPIMYPGQRVAVQWNGSYTRVYPADIESRFNRAM